LNTDPERSGAEATLSTRVVWGRTPTNIWQLFLHFALPANINQTCRSRTIRRSSVRIIRRHHTQRALGRVPLVKSRQAVEHRSRKIWCRSGLKNESCPGQNAHKHSGVFLTFCSPMSTSTRRADQERSGGLLCE
jgi:hypothetical protein